MYLAILALVIGVGIWIYNKGEANCLAREKAAAEKQAIADVKIAQETTDALTAEINRLRGIAPAYPPRVQCYTRPVSAPTGKPGAPTAPSTPGGSVREVPGGPGSGPDLGPGLQGIALSADYVSALYRACLKELKEP